MVKKLIIGIFLFAILESTHSEEPIKNTIPKQPQWSEAKSVSAVKYDLSLPLRMIAPKAIVSQSKRGLLIKDPGVILKDNANHKSSLNDPILQTIKGGQNIPAPIASFHAISNIAGVSPPDPTGDVGVNNVVVMSNLSFHILDKSGNSVFGPAANNTLWDGFGGDCETDNSGDPIVLYDQLADRWLLSQFTSSGPEFFNCVAISVSSDPTGSYHRWAISNGTKFPDYPKYGVWSDGYYISTRDFDSNDNYVSVGVYALKRDDFVSGNPTPTIVYMFEDRTNNPWRVGDGLLPADIDGFELPPVNTPQFFIGTMDDGAGYGAAQDALLLWKYEVDYDTPANSTFSLTDTIPISSFDTIFPCSSGRNCIPQKDTTNEIDIQSYRQRPLHRLAYRNFGTHESLVTNQSVEAAPGIAGVRWWEIRNPSTTPVLHQEGTFAPGVTDNIHRWMGSIAMDSNGNIGLAYSASSDEIYPSIRYTGRINSDSLGLMTLGEGSIVEGTGSQTSSQRWGDYTSLTVDPTDDCTFWHVNEYYETTSGNGWELRAGAFKFDECGSPGFYLRATSSTEEICTSADATYEITVGSIANFSSPTTLSLSGVPNQAITTYSLNPVPTQPSSTSITISNSKTFTAGSYPLILTGMAQGTEDKSIQLTLNVYDNIPMAPQLVSPLNASENNDVMPSLNWTGDQSIEYTVEISTDENFNNIIFTGTTPGTTLVPNMSLTSNTEYYWRVKANNSCGESIYSEVFSFITTPAPGDCQNQLVNVTLTSYSFEYGPQGWTSGTNQGSDTWRLSSENPAPMSSNQHWHVDDQLTTSDSYLTSPVISLPSNRAPLTFQFQNYQSIESNNSTACWDGGLLEISLDGGEFNQIENSLLATDPYDGILSGGPLSGSNAWCGDPQEYLNSIVDINSFAGSNVQFRFRMSTDSSVGNPGWDIDDVKVTGCATDLIYRNGLD
jgi:hypothetical protein